jgi:hypothetical protein
MWLKSVSFKETRTVDGVEVEIAELLWADGSGSFEVVDAQAQELIGFTDSMPSDTALQGLVRTYLMRS